MHIASHEHDVEHRRREIPVDRAALRHIGDALAHLVDRLAPKAHIARDGLLKAEDSLQERRFSCAVRPDDRTSHARRHIEIDVPEHRALAVRHRHILHMKQHLFSHIPPSFPRISQLDRIERQKQKRAVARPSSLFPYFR